MKTLASYAQGAWVEGKGKATTLHHAVTGEPVAAASSDGINFAGMLGGWAWIGTALALLRPRMVRHP